MTDVFKISRLQSIKEYNRVLQSITEYYRVILAHLLDPIFGLVGCNLLFTSVFCLAWCSRFHIILAPDIWYLMSHNPIFSGPDRFVPGTRRKASAEKKQKLGLERKVLSTGRGGSRVCYFVISDCCVLWYIFWLTVE